MKKSYPLVDNVLTVTAANDLVHRIQSLVTSLYQTEGSAKDKITHYLTDNEYHNLISYTKENDLNIDDPQELQNLLQDVSNHIEERPIMSLNISFTPTSDFVNDLAQWLTVHGPEPVRLNINVNPDLVAGLVIGFKGKIFDYSFKDTVSN